MCNVSDTYLYYFSISFGIFLVSVHLERFTVFRLQLKKILLPQEHLIGCRGVKMFLLKDVTITSVTTATVTTATITTFTI